MEYRGIFIPLNKCFKFKFRKTSPSGQIATIIIIILAAVLILLAVVINLGKLSHMKTLMVNAADQSALQLGSTMGSIAYKYSIEACNGGTAGKWVRSYSLIFKIIAVIVAIILVIIGLWCANCTFPWVAVIITAVLGIAMVLYSEFVQDPKQMSALNRQLARVPDRYRYSATVIQNALLHTVNDPTKIVDSSDYDADGRTDDKVSKFTQWWYDMLEGMANQGDAYKQQAKNAFSDYYQNTFLPQARDFSVYIGDSDNVTPYTGWVASAEPTFRDLLEDLRTEDDNNCGGSCINNCHITLDNEYFDNPPSFVDTSCNLGDIDYPDCLDDTGGGTGLNQPDYLFQDLVGQACCDPDTGATDYIGIAHPQVASDFVSLLEGSTSYIWSGGTSLMTLDSLLSSVGTDWSNWKAELDSWVAKLQEIETDINNRKNEIDQRIAAIDDYLDNPGNYCAANKPTMTCYSSPDACPASDSKDCDADVCKTEKEVLEDERGRLEALLTSLSNAISKTQDFSSDVQGFTDAIDTLQKALGTGDNYCPEMEKQYDWSDNLGSHYVKVHVTAYSVPKLEIESKSRWYGKKKRYVLRDYTGDATVTITRSDASKQTNFAGGLNFWKFRYTKDGSDSGEYSASATVHWGDCCWSPPKLTG